MTVTESAQRLLGPSVCRALAAKAYETKKRGAKEVEEIVRFYQQRDPSGAASKIFAVSTTLANEFLQSDLPDNQIGGAVALVGVARGLSSSLIPTHVPQILEALIQSFLTSPNRHIVSRYYIAECLYNMALIAPIETATRLDALTQIHKQLWLITDPIMQRASDYVKNVTLDLAEANLTKEQIPTLLAVLFDDPLLFKTLRFPDYLLQWADLLVQKNEWEFNPEPLILGLLRLANRPLEMSSQTKIKDILAQSVNVHVKWNNFDELNALLMELDALLIPTPQGTCNEMLFHLLRVLVAQREEIAVTLTPLIVGATTAILSHYPNDVDVSKNVYEILEYFAPLWDASTESIKREKLTDLTQFCGPRMSMILASDASARVARDWLGRAQKNAIPIDASLTQAIVQLVTDNLNPTACQYGVELLETILGPDALEGLLMKGIVSKIVNASTADGLRHDLDSVAEMCLDKPSLMGVIVDQLQALGESVNPLKLEVAECMIIMNVTAHMSPTEVKSISIQLLPEHSWMTKIILSFLRDDPKMWSVKRKAVSWPWYVRQHEILLLLLEFPRMALLREELSSQFYQAIGRALPYSSPLIDLLRHRIQCGCSENMRAIFLLPTEPPAASDLTEQQSDNELIEEAVHYFNQIILPATCERLNISLSNFALAPSSSSSSLEVRQELPSTPKSATSPSSEMTKSVTPSPEHLNTENMNCDPVSSTVENTPVKNSLKRIDTTEVTSEA